MARQSFKKYDHKTVESKWQKQWQKDSIYTARDFDGKKPKKYILVEYPYPSGEGLHIGHAFTNTIGDVLTRYQRMRGKNVLFPMGWDSFGLPTENSAIRLGINPSLLTKKNTALFKKQNISLGISFDWDREIDTSDPHYYKWTQWIFLQLYKKGLAYKAESLVGWCPNCRIILANEEVVAGKCERCGTSVSYRKQKQWLLRITAYADRLADELDLVDYPDYVKKSQRDWIGKKQWVDIEYPIEGKNKTIKVSTTQPDTNYGATFIVVAPEFAERELVELMEKEKRQDVINYINTSKSKSELERISEGKVKTGVFTGLYAKNRLNERLLPIYVTDFVLVNVGTGAVVGVPGHDKRDFEFAQKFNLPVVRVVARGKGNISEIDSLDKVDEGEGIAVNSSILDGLTTKQAREKITNYLKTKGWGKETIRYHLRDWVFSRQHYWGEPIPIVICPKCGEVPILESELPLLLPKVKKYQPTETGESPLANISSWVNTKCPKCFGRAKRETDTMPNWAGSSWYYLRFCDPKNNQVLADKKKLDYWQPVDVYIGGAEHTTLHLLYSRFWHKFLNDLKLVPGKEPYAARRQHGVILGEDGMRMSKSKGNVINPQEMIDKFGADSLRLYLMFMGPYDATMAWNSTGIEGMERFVQKLWKLFFYTKTIKPEKKKELLTLMHQTIKIVSEDIESLRYNTAISQIMIFTNFLNEHGVDEDALKNLCLILASFAPHLAEEVWQTKKYGKESVHISSWPKYDSKLTVMEIITIPVQINGKLRSKVKVESTKSRIKEDVIDLAKNDKKIATWLKGKTVKKEIFVEGKLVNFVIE